MKPRIILVVALAAVAAYLVYRATRPAAPLPLPPPASASGGTGLNVSLGFNRIWD